MPKKDELFTTRRTKKTESSEKKEEVKEVKKTKKEEPVKEEPNKTDELPKEPEEKKAKAKKEQKPKEETTSISNDEQKVVQKIDDKAVDEVLEVEEPEEEKDIKPTITRIESFEDSDISQDIVDELEKVKNYENEMYQKLLAHKENKTIVWGIVSGVEGDSTYNKAIITVMWNGIRILIPDTAYFEKTWKFQNGYESMSAEEKMESRILAARETLFANCPVIILGVSKQKIEDGKFEGEEEIVAIGSRVDALAMRRDKYFLHRYAKKPVDVAIGNIAPANIVYVAKEFITVECLGVETRIDCYNLSEDKVINNAEDFFKVGEVIEVRVKKIRFEGDDVRLTVSHMLNQGSKMVRTLKVPSSHIGFVKSFNKLKDIYTIILKNGAKVSVHINGTLNHTEINVGDRVAVFIKDVKEDYAIGVAMKV